MALLLLLLTGAVSFSMSVKSKPAVSMDDAGPWILTDSELMFNLLDVNSDGLVDSIDTRAALDGSNPGLRQRLISHSRQLKMEEEEGEYEDPTGA